MPELPEVATVTRSLKKHLSKQKFESLEVLNPKVLHNFTLDDFNKRVRGRKIQRIFRRAKFIILDFKTAILAIHLRMTGKLYVRPCGQKLGKHVAATLKFSNLCLIFEDARKFGRFYLYPNLDYLDQKLGVEPLEAAFSDAWLVEHLKQKERQIKGLLLDQSFVAGLGNIYTDEALWYAKIHPLTKAANIPKAKVKKLRAGIVKILQASIELGGSTIKDYTYDFDFVGSYALNLKVYGRKNEPCHRCGTPIIKKIIAQRGTYICPKCQKNKTKS